MSSTVGYGVEVTGEAFGEPIEHGDWEFDFPAGLTIVRSRGEYSSEEEKVYILISNTITEAGSGHPTGTSIKFTEPDETALTKYVKDSGVTVIGTSGWVLADYYVYS